MKKHKNKLKISLDDHAIEEAVLKLAPIFNMFGWTWWNSDKPPTADEITKTIEGLITDVVEHGYEYAATGRIVVRKMYDDNITYLDISLDLSQVYEEGYN